MTTRNTQTLFDKNNPAACGVQMHGTVKVGEKGQIVIPKEVRDQLKIKSGDTMLVITKHGKAIGIIKQDDLPELIAFVQEEINSKKQF